MTDEHMDRIIFTYKENMFVFLNEAIPPNLQWQDTPTHTLKKRYIII